MKESEKSFKDLYLQELSKESYWRLFLDGNRQRSDNKRAVDFEGEVLMDFQHGYLIWMLQEVHSFKFLKESALDLISNKLNDSLTWEFLMSLNKTSFPFVDYLKFDNGDNIDEGRTSMLPAIFGDLKTEKDINNVLNKSILFAKKFNSKDPWVVLKGENVTHIGTSVSVELVKQAYDSMLKEYEKKVEVYKSRSLTDLLILTVVDFLQNLELAHIFKDGNCRELYLVLNKELMKNGLCPTILDDPNDLDCKDPEELVEKVKKGQEAFKMLVEKGVPYENALTIEEIKKNIKDCPVKTMNIGQSLDLGFFDRVDEKDYDISPERLAKMIPNYYKAIVNAKTVTDVKKVQEEFLFQDAMLLKNFKEMYEKSDKKDVLKSQVIEHLSKSTKWESYLGYTKFILKNIVQKGNDSVEDALLNLKQMYATVNAYNEEIEVSKFTDIDKIVSFVDDSVKYHLEHDVLGDVVEN